MLKLGGIDDNIATEYHQCFSRVLSLFRKLSDLLCDLPKALTYKTQVCGWARVTIILCAKHLIQHFVIDLRVFSLGDFVLESLFCAQRL